MFIKAKKLLENHFSDVWLAFHARGQVINWLIITSLYGLLVYTDLLTCYVSVLLLTKMLPNDIMKIIAAILAPWALLFLQNAHS